MRSVQYGSEESPKGQFHRCYVMDVSCYQKRRTPLCIKFSY